MSITVSITVLQSVLIAIFYALLSVLSALLSILQSVENSGMFCHSDFTQNYFFGETKSSKTAIFATFRGSEFCSFGKFQDSKSAKIQKIQIQYL